MDDPDARVPCDRFGAVIGRAMQERPMKNMGVRIATETPIGAFHYSTIWFSAPTASARG